MQSDTHWLPEPVQCLLGGAIVGIASSVLLKGTGQISGVSGIVKGASKIFRLFSPSTARSSPWKAAFIGGLTTGGLLVSKEMLGPAMISAVGMSPVAMLASGTLVGFGTSVKLINLIGINFIVCRCRMDVLQDMVFVVMNF